MTFGSLFTGIGGMDLGLERAGMTCRWQVEIDPYCQKILKKHWPDVPKLGDIREISSRHLTNVDLFAGGDPCQENSNARQRTGLEQPSLGGEFIRLIGECRPRFVLRENPSVVRSDAPWPWHRFRSELEQIGYSVLPFRIRACCLGFEHRRERLFLFAEFSNSVQTRLSGDEFEELERKRRETFCDTTRQDRRSTTPRIYRRTDGVPHRVDRTKALGNAVVPHVAEWIGRRIMEATNG